MPHFMSITAKMTAYGSSNVFVNTYHYSADGGVTFGSDDAAKTTQANAAITQLKTFYSALGVGGLLFSWTIGDVVLEYDGSPTPKYVTATPQTSTLTPGALTPNQVCAVISWRTASAGRSYRGRSYIGPIRAEKSDWPNWQTGVVTSFNAAAAALIAAPSGSQLVPCVYSPTLNTTAKITSGTSSTAVRTLRSRAN